MTSIRIIGLLPLMFCQNEETRVLFFISIFDIYRSAKELIY